MAGPVRPPAVSASAGGVAAQSWRAQQRPACAYAQRGERGGAGVASHAPLMGARRFTARRSGRRRTVAAFATIPVPPPPPDGTPASSSRHQQQQLDSSSSSSSSSSSLSGAPPSSSSPGGVGPDLGWRLDFSESYIRGKLLGQGSFGAVYLGIDLRNGQEVAIKVMPKVRGKLTRQRTCEKLLKEASILAALQDCPGAVRLLGCYEAGDEVMVVTELCSGGDLQRLSDEAGALAERGAALVMYEALKVVKCCHDRGVLHGDVKPANFVLKHATRNPLRAPGDLDLLFTPWLRAIDFGCSQYVREERFGKRTGTPVYMAPEVFARDYGLEADVWSAGIMLYQLYARRFPYWETYEACRAARLEEVAALVGAGAIPLDYGPWRRMTPEGLDFVRSCLAHDHVDRMTVDEALDHAWFDAWLPSESELSKSREQREMAEQHQGQGQGQGQQQQVAATSSAQQRLVASHEARASMRQRERERDGVVLPAFASASASASAPSPGPSAAALGVSGSSAVEQEQEQQQQQELQPGPPLAGAVARALANGGRPAAASALRPPPPPPRDISPANPASPEPGSAGGGMMIGGRSLSGAAAAAATARPRQGGEHADAAASAAAEPPLQMSGAGGGGGVAALVEAPSSPVSGPVAQAMRSAWYAAQAAVAGARRALSAQLEASAAMNGGGGGGREGDENEQQRPQTPQQPQR